MIGERIVCRKHFLMSQSSFICTLFNSYTYDVYLSSLEVIIFFLNESELIGSDTSITIVCTQLNGSTYTRGIMVIVVGIGHGDTSSIPGRDWLHFT